MGDADQASGTWFANGAAYPVQLYGDIGVTPENLLNQINPYEDFVWGHIDEYGDYAFPGSGMFLDEFGYSIGNMDIGGGSFRRQSISGEPWGVWQMAIGGLYSGTITNNWSMDYHYEVWDESDNLSGIFTKYQVTDITYTDGNLILMFWSLG